MSPKKDKNQEIESFLEKIKKQGRSSPAGMCWNDFFIFLKKFKQPDDTDPPVPLILAASGESDASKHFRLSNQLYWAFDHGCLDEALAFIKNLNPDKWNLGSIEEWNNSSY